MSIQATDSDTITTTPTVGVVKRPSSVQPVQPAERSALDESDAPANS